MIAFTIPGPAQGQGRPRMSAIGGFARAYKAKKDRSNEGMIAMLARMAMKGRAPLEGPLALSVCVKVAPTPGWPKKRIEACLAGETMPTGKPDLDNVIKAILDACNAVVFADDKQIASIYAVRLFAPLAETTVRIEPATITTRPPA